MSRPEIEAAYKAALGRLRDGRRNEYRSYSEAERRQAWLEARELPKMDLYGPEFRPPETPGEWLDDRVIEWGHRAGDPAAPLLVALAEAARESTEAAVRVLKLARGLAPAVQWTAFKNIQHWGSGDETGRTGNARLSAVLLAEWSRLKLAEKDPARTKPEPGPSRAGLGWRGRTIDAQH